MRNPMEKFLRAGPLEQQQMLRKLGPSIIAKVNELRETAAEELAAGLARIEALYGDGPRNAWKGPLLWFSFGFILVAAVMLAVALTFNEETMNLDPVAAVSVGLGLPVALLVLKAAKDTVYVGRVEELPAIVAGAKRGLYWAVPAMLVTFVGYGVARSDGALPESLSFFGLLALELALAFGAAHLLVLLLVHSQAPLHLKEAERCLRAADKLEPFAEAAANAPQFPGPGQPPGPNGQNGATSIASAALKPAGAISRAAVPTIALVLACLGAPVSLADTGAQTVAVFLDRTPSVAELSEFNDVANYVAESLPRLFLLDSLATSAELFVWTGDPLSSRVATQRWPVPPLPAIGHKSLFKRRQEHLRLEALRQRGLILEEVAKAIVDAAAQPTDSVGQSCIWALLKDARASQALSIVISDAVVACRGDVAPAASSANGRVLVIVTASAGDGALAADRVAERVARLQALGFFAVNAREIRSRDWASLFLEPTNTPPGAGHR